MVERVVSLAPSATTIIQSVGKDDCLVGATAHGTHNAPVLGEWLNPDIDRIASIDPDLVVTTDTLQATVVDQLVDRGYEPLHLTPSTLEDVLSSIERLGEALGAASTAESVVADMRETFEQLRTKSSDGERPTVYCEEWSEPPMAAGNWVPELVEIAGGHYPFRRSGERSQRVDRATVEDHQPEHIILHLCGMGESVDRRSVLERGWEVPALDEGRVWVVDDRLLNQPAPVLAAGARAIRACLDRDPDADSTATTVHE